MELQVRGTKPCRVVDNYFVCLRERCRALRVWTANTLYEIEVTDAATQKVVIRGGQFFDEPRVARLAGARALGMDLWRGSIYVGLRLELHVEDQTILTSAVRRIEIQV